MKEAQFHPAALKILREYPVDVRKEIGKALLDLQHGAILTMPLSRPMPSVASGAEELRIRDQAGIYRVFYFARSLKGVLVFHAFSKKTQKTPQKEIDLGKKRLKEMLYEKD